MTEYTLARLGKKESFVPTFNQAAEKLKANKDVAILDSFDFTTGSGFLIETTGTAIEQIKKDLPGWTVGQNHQNPLP